MQPFIKKWPLMLLKGILLIALSIYVFNNPEATLISLAFYLSLLVLFDGLAGITGWLLTSTKDRETASFLWSFFSSLFGLLLLVKIDFAMKLLTSLIGIWMIITGLWVGKEGWANTSKSSLRVVTLLTGIISVTIGIIIIINLGAGALTLSTIVGVQLLFAGYRDDCNSNCKKKNCLRSKTFRYPIKEQVPINNLWVTI